MRMRGLVYRFDRRCVPGVAFGLRGHLYCTSFSPYCTTLLHMAPTVLVTGATGSPVGAAARRRKSEAGADVAVQAKQGL